MNKLTDLLSDNEIIETLWYIFDMEKNNPHCFDKEQVRHYMFDLLFPLLENHGYCLKKSQKAFMFRNILEDKINKDKKGQIMLCESGIKEWMSKGEHLPCIIRDFSDAGDFCCGAERIKPELSQIMSRKDAHIFLIDYLLHYLAMTGWVLGKKAGKSKDYNDILRACEQKKSQYFELILSGYKKGI